MFNRPLRAPRLAAAPCVEPDFIVFICNELLFIMDVGVAIFLGYLSGVLTFSLNSSVHFSAGNDSLLWRQAIFGGAIAALIMRDPHVKKPVARPRLGLLLKPVMERGAITMAMLLSLGLITRAFDDMARTWVVLWAGTFALWVAASRLYVGHHLFRLSQNGALRETIAVVGQAGPAARLAMQLSTGTDVRAVIECLDQASRIGVQDSLEQLQELVRCGAINTVVVALGPGDAGDAEPLLEHLSALPIAINVCPDLSGLTQRTAEARILAGVPMAVITDRPLNYVDILLKAVIDRVIAALLLVIASPLMLAIAIAISLEDQGPIIFRQRRSGWGGKLFTIYKFRSMHYTGESEATHQTRRNDARCTWVGSRLRRTSFDELPQLWNVLIGDMSLVGPRPHADALHSLERAACRMVGDYARRQRVKPGITGWAQVHGCRGPITTPEHLRRRVEYDLYYIDHWSIWLDLQIILRTPLTVLSAENAF
jgi:putative colanic acid biosynthesis UDP-glucose lipid carrier transferase